MSGTVDAVLLLLGVAGALTRPRGVPAWLVPLVAAVASIAGGSTHLHDLRSTADLLAGPLAFLVAAVPLAVLLDRLGFFDAAAQLASDRPHLEAWLWALAGGVTIVLNLDAAVVLLTPLYIRIADRHGRDRLALAIIPALQACLASSLLPVSNLTNLLAAEHLDLSTADFVRNLGLPTLAATTVGFATYRLVFGDAPARPAPPTGDVPLPRRPLVVGGLVVVGVLVAFLLGATPWIVAVAADAVLLAILRVAPPWRSVPWETALLAFSLAVLAAGAARHLDLHDLLGDTSTFGHLRIAVVAGVAASALNNLPAVLVGIRAIDPAHHDAVWPLLLGVNIVPLVVLTGSLSNLLWQQTAGAGGIRLGARRFSWIGVRVALPAFAASLAVHVAVR